MALGFKIADGYVEVHADYDRGELRDAAHDAANDFGDEFGDDKEHERAGKRAGGHVGDGIQKGATDSVKKDNEFGRLLSEILDRKMVQQKSNHERIGQRIARNIRDGLVGPKGAGTAASAFGRSFIEAVSFGQADIGRGVSQKLMPKMAMAGTALGAALAGALILQLGNLVTAGLPLVLGGAFAAIPFFTLIRSGMEKEKGKWHTLNNEMGRELDRIVSTWKAFKKEISAPWKPTVLTTLRGLSELMNKIEQPLKHIGKLLAPAFGQMLQGVFNAIEAFVRAVEPAMPGIAAGLKQWGVELPKIATALGDAISQILKDPEAVKQAVTDFSQFLQDAIEFGGQAATAITNVARAYGEFARFIDEQENGPLGGDNLLLPKPETVHAQANAIAQAFTWLKGQLGVAWAEMKEHARLTWTELKSGWDSVKVVWNAVVTFFQAIPGRVQAALAFLKAKIITPFEQAFDAVRAKIEGWVASVVAFFKSLPGKASAALSNLWSSMKGRFDQVVTSGKQRAQEAVNGVVNFFKTLPGKAASAVSSLWSRMVGAFNSAVSGAKAKANAIVTGAISILKTLPGKAGAAVSAVKSRILGAFSGAASWLYSAGRSIITGLASGIRSAISGAVAAAASAARAALSAAKGALGISSPSKVFAEEVGVPAAQGIAVGLRERFPKEMAGLRKSLPQMQMAPAMAGAAAGGGSGFSPTVNLYMQPGFYSENAAAKRALTKDVFLALEAYRKDYER